MSSYTTQTIAENKMAALRSQARWFAGFFNRQAERIIQEAHNDRS